MAAAERARVASYGGGAVAAAAALLSAAACGADGPFASDESSLQPVTYGGDDRVEWNELGVPARSDIRDTVAALIFARRVRIDGYAVDLSAPTLELEANLCPDQRFLEQPAAAWCTAVLVDVDLVLTAAHCITSLDECRRLRVVFDFLYDEAGTRAITPASVFDCRRLVSISGADWVAVQLDRPAVGRAPASLAEPPQAGATVLGASHGQGLPLKVDPTGRILESEGRTVRVATDAFAGASGSPLFDDRGELVALLQEGRVDYTRRGDCRVVRDVDPADGVEGATAASVVREELCDSGWPSDALCGRPPTCSDGVCSPSEAEAPRCDADCPLPSCGDGLCELSERESCPADCAPPLEPGVPFEWFCEAPHHGTGDGCNCACGAPDPDCEDRPCASYGPSHRLEPPSAAGRDGAMDASPDGSPDSHPNSEVALHGGCAIAAPSRPPGSMAYSFLAVLALAMLRRA